MEVEVVKQSTKNREEKSNRQEQQQQPKAITMAEQLKEKASLDKKTKLVGDGNNIRQKTDDNI